MATLTPISPLPFVGFTVEIPAATVVVLNPQPYSNTKEVILYNTAASDDMWVQITKLQATPSSAFLMVGWPQDQTDGGLAVAWGAAPAADTITLDGNVLTANAGPRVAGTDTFSVDKRAQARLTIGTSPIVGDIFKINTGKGLQTATCIAGARAPGSLDFTYSAVNTTLATNLAAMFNDTTQILNAQGFVVDARVSSNVVTLTAGNSARGTDGNNPVRRIDGSSYVSGELTGLSIDTTATDVAIVDFTGGVDCDNSYQVTTAGAINRNQPQNYAWSIIEAINDATNSFAATTLGHYSISTEANSIVIPAYMDFPGSAVGINLLSVATGTSGDGIAYSESTSGDRLDVTTTPSAGGVDAVPSSITAATSSIIPAGASLSLNIGPEGNRQPLGTNTFWAANDGSTLGIIVQMASNGPEDLNVTYVNSRGYPEGQ